MAEIRGSENQPPRREASKQQEGQESRKIAHSSGAGEGDSSATKSASTRADRPAKNQE